MFTSDKSNKKKESTLKESSGFLNLSFVTAMLHNNAAMTDTDFEHRLHSGTRFIWLRIAYRGRIL